MSSANTSTIEGVASGSNEDFKPQVLSPSENAEIRKELRRSDWPPPPPEYKCACVMCHFDTHKHHGVRFSSSNLQVAPRRVFKCRNLEQFVRLCGRREKGAPGSICVGESRFEYLMRTHIVETSFGERLQRRAETFYEVTLVVAKLLNFIDMYFKVHGPFPRKVLVVILFEYIAMNWSNLLCDFSTNQSFLKSVQKKYRELTLHEPFSTGKNFRKRYAFMDETPTPAHAPSTLRFPTYIA
jgi:hypothetical protein